jgi:crotonobetainyl-CoA:carnitine CoA-transferase CaiB-like acyl-CoA transferase
MSGMRAPLSGITVLDLTHFVAGPWCTMLLADLGADVIKVEPPCTGEIGRRMGGVYADGESAIFLGFNRNKRSVALNLKHDEGRRVFYRLVERADVVVQNFRPGTTQRLGVDSATLLARNPQLVYCAVSAFGQDGPYARQPANDPIIQAITGALLAQDNRKAAIRMGVSLPDFAAGVLAALGVVAALYRRLHTRKGGLVDLNLLDAQLFAQIDRLQSLLPGAASTEQHDEGATATGSGAYRCADGRFLYVDIEDYQATRRLCEVLGWPERDGAADAASGADLNRMIATQFARQPRAHWIVVLGVGGVACAPVNTLPETFASVPGLTLDVIHPTIGELRLMRTPLAADPDWPLRQSPPPLLGQHTEEILAEMGYSDEAMAELANSAIIGFPRPRVGSEHTDTAKPVY